MARVLTCSPPSQRISFSPEEIGNTAFVEMLVYGAQQACINYFISSGELVEAISGALSSSPVSGTPSGEWTSEENVAALSKALHVVTQGTSIYCPSEAPDLPPDDDLASEEFISAWQVYTGDG